MEKNNARFLSDEISLTVPGEFAIIDAPKRDPQNRVPIISGSDVASPQGIISRVKRVMLMM